MDQSGLGDRRKTTTMSKHSTDSERKATVRRCARCKQYRTMVGEICPECLPTGDQTTFDELEDSE